MVPLKLEFTLDWRIEASAILIQFKYAWCRETRFRFTLTGIYQLRLEARMRKYAPAQGEQRYDDAQSYPGRLPVPRRHRRCGRSRLILLCQLTGHRSKNFFPISLQIL